MYTVWHVRLNGHLARKEHLDNRFELEDWAAAAESRFARIAVRNDRTGAVRIFDHTGIGFEHIGTAETGSASTIRRIAPVATGQQVVWRAS